MKPTYESIKPNFGSSFSYFSFEPATNIKANVWHYHPEIEIIYVNGGSGKRQIGTHISYFNRGDLILIGSNLPHCGLTNEQTGNKSEVVILMKPDFLGEDIYSIPEMEKIRELFELAKAGIAFKGNTKASVGRILEGMKNDPPFKRLTKLLNVLNKLAETEEFTVLNADGYILKTQVQDNERINTVFNYVKDNFKEPIPLDDIADLVGMTSPSFARYFKKITNKTFTQFVNEYRLVHATKLLTEQKMSILEVSFESGFNNFSHFNKLFKQFTGKSASNYRKQLNNVIVS